MKKLLSYSVFCIMTIFLKSEPVVQTGEEAGMKNILHINLTQLLASPSKFTNKKVRFTAYVVRNNSDTFLFNSKEDIENFRLDSAVMGQFTDKIDLKLFIKEMNPKLLTVEGVFTVREPDSAPPVVGLLSISYMRYR